MDEEMEEVRHVPLQYFKFRSCHLDKWWADRLPHLLQPDVDFPAEMTFKQLEQRMRMAAWNRGALVDVWPRGDGGVYVCFKDR